MRFIKALLFAIVVGVAAGAAVFGAGFGLAWLLGPEAGAALGMIVPMFGTPLAALLGATWGFMRMWRSSATA